MKIGLRGVTLTVASGDSGANGRTDEQCSENHFNPDFPSCSPYITSVGGTEFRDVTYMIDGPPECSLFSPSSYFCVGHGYAENAVSYGFSEFASGGGFSNISPLPSWQAAAVKTYLNTPIGKALPKGYFNASNRGYPDICAVAETAILISMDDQIQPVGGTSAASPIVAGIFSLLNDYSLTKTSKSLGPMNQFLYLMATKKPGAFTDITVGDNHCTESGCSGCKGYTATTGWDPVTGLGSPVYPQMLEYLQSIL